MSSIEEKMAAVAPSDQKISKREYFAYGLGALGTNFVYMITATFTLKYYQVYLGADANAISAIIMAAMILDALNDPLTGIIVAKVHNSKLGKYKPWIFFGTLVNAACLYGLFAVPQAVQGSGAGLIAWCAVFYLLWSTTYDAFDIPFWSMIPAITNTGKEREKMTQVGRTMAGVGCAMISALTLIITPILGGGETYVDSSTGKTLYTYASFIKGFNFYSLAIAVFFIFSSTFLVFNIKERQKVEAEKPVKISEMFKSLLSNSQVLVIAVAIVAVNVGVGITSNLTQYFIQFDIGGDYGTSQMYFSGVTFVAQVLGMVLIYPLLRKKMSNKKIFAVAMIGDMLGYVALLIFALFNFKTIFPFFVPGFLIGFSSGLLNIVTTVFLADAIDYGEVKNGHREESVVFSMQTFVVKIASGISIGVTGLVVTLTGLKTDEGSVNTVETLTAIRYIMTFVPIVFLLFSYIFFAKKYFLTDEKMAEITKELSLKRSKEAQTIAPSAAVPSENNNQNLNQ